MKTGEIAALIHTVGKPNDLFIKNKNDSGFKFLPVPFDKFDDYYVPAVFTAEDYPGYVKPGEKVETIGVQAVLAVYNWPRESDRFRRVQRFIEHYFERFANFHQPPYHPKWKSINLAAKVPGWTRYWVADERLKQMATAKPRRSTRRTPARPPAGRARRPGRRRGAGAPVPAVPRVEQEAKQVTVRPLQQEEERRWRAQSMRSIGAGSGDDLEPSRGIAKVRASFSVCAAVLPAFAAMPGGGMGDWAAAQTAMDRASPLRRPSWPSPPRRLPCRSRSARRAPCPATASCACADCLPASPSPKATPSRRARGPCPCSACHPSRPSCRPVFLAAPRSSSIWSRWMAPCWPRPGRHW